MKDVRLFDKAFTTASASISDPNINIVPKYIHWLRKGELTDPTFFADYYISQVINYLSFGNCMAWLLEPRGLRPEHYKITKKLKDYFKFIFTFDREFLDNVKNARFYPMGGCRIAYEHWGIHPKKHNLSIIASYKNQLEGHKLRHEIIEKFGYAFDGIYGAGKNYIRSKYNGLALFRYSVVIESCREDYYFTEKLIDSLLVGTIPIYWGCPSINKFFDMNGILYFNTIEEFYSILSYIGELDYQARLESIKNNFKIAGKYAVAEDWIYENYRELFE